MGGIHSRPLRRREGGAFSAGWAAKKVGRPSQPRPDLDLQVPVWGVAASMHLHDLYDLCLMPGSCMFRTFFSVSALHRSSQSLGLQSNRAELGSGSGWFKVSSVSHRSTYPSVSVRPTNPENMGRRHSVDDDLTADCSHPRGAAPRRRRHVGDDTSSPLSPHPRGS